MANWLVDGPSAPPPSPSHTFSGEELSARAKQDTHYLTRTGQTWAGVFCFGSSFSLLMDDADAVVHPNMWLLIDGITTEHLSNSMSVSNFSQACFQWIGVYQAMA